MSDDKESCFARLYRRHPLLFIGGGIFVIGLIVTTVVLSPLVPAPLPEPAPAPAAGAMSVATSAASPVDGQAIRPLQLKVISTDSIGFNLPEPVFEAIEAINRYVRAHLPASAHPPVQIVTNQRRAYEYVRIALIGLGINTNHAPPRYGGEWIELSAADAKAASPNPLTVTVSAVGGGGGSETLYSYPLSTASQPATTTNPTAAGDSSGFVSDVLIVLGNMPYDDVTPSWDLIARAQCAARHYHQLKQLSDTAGAGGAGGGTDTSSSGGGEIRVVFSGGPFFGSSKAIPEAHQMAIVARLNGIPEHAIRVEHESLSTIANAK